MARRFLSALIVTLVASNSGWAQTPIDLSGWIAESYPAVSGFGAGSWEIEPDGLSVLQTVNGQPTLFVSDFDLSGMQVEGVIEVETTGDDDLIGFAIGYQPGDVSNPDAEYLLLDWKQSTQGFDFGTPSCTPSSTCPAGLAVSQVTGIPTADEFWGHEDFDSPACSPLGDGLVELARGASLGSTGWSDLDEYRFRIVFTTDRLQVFVDDQLEIDVAGSFADGRLAFYNFSQGSVRYSGLELSPAGMFRRGDLDGDEVTDLSDEAAFLDWRYSAGPSPVDCALLGLVEPADTNDNESVTIADYLALRNANLGLSTLPEPLTICNFDPTSTERGFGAVDPAFRIAAGDPLIDDMAGPLDRTVRLPIFVEVPVPMTGLEVLIEYDPAVLTPFTLAADGEPAWTALAGTDATLEAPGQLLIANWATNDGDILWGADPGEFQLVGEVAFHLADFAVFRTEPWVPQGQIAGITVRATIVDESFVDHHPELLAGVSEFARADANNDDLVDIADPVFTLEYLFVAGPLPTCLDAADANNDGAVDISDAVFTLEFLFAGGAAPPFPYPGCGFDVGGVDALDCASSICM